MPLPGDVSTFTLTFGPYTDAAGYTQLAGTTGKLTPVDANGVPVTVLHTADGSVIVPAQILVTIGSDGTESITGLAHTDDTHLTPSPFLYQMTWDTPPYRSLLKNKLFAVPIAAGGTVDFDLLANGTTTTGVAINLPSVISVNGHTGTVTLAAADVGADSSGAAAAAQAAAVAAIPSMATIAADPALKAALGLAPVTTVTASGTLASGKHTPVDATAGAMTMTLPTGQAEGVSISVEKADTSTNAVTVTGNMRGVAGQSITLLTQYEVRQFLADSAGSWHPIADHRTKTSLDAAYQIQPLVNRTAMQKWQIALAGRRAATANVLLVDNSVGEGEGASVWANRYPRVLQDSLRARLQPPGIAGVTDPYLTRSALSPIPTGVPYTEAGTVSAWSQGLGGRGWHLGTGGTATITFTGTRAKVDYTIASGGGIMGVQVDGGTVNLVNTFTSGAQSYGQYDTGALTAGAHTLVLTRDASSATGKDAFVDGVQLFNGDESAGVRVWGASKFGITAQTYAATVLNDYSKATWAVAVVGFDENDTGRTVSQYTADLQAVISMLRGKGLASTVLLIHRPTPGTYDATLWATFGAAKAAIALGDPDTAYLDLSATMPSYDTTGNTLGIYYDTKHFNDKGQSWMADLIASVLLPH